MILTDDQTMHSLEKMAYTNGRSDWIRFDNAFFHQPLCCPSRATFLSGQYSHHHGVERNTDAKRFKHKNALPVWLSKAGYETALIGKYLNGYPWGRPPFKPPGWDTWFAFLLYNGRRSEYGKYLDYDIYNGRKTKYFGTTESDYSTDVLGKRAISFLRQQAPGNPFFLWLSFFGAHGPYTPAPRHETLFQSEVAPRTPNFNEADVSDKPTQIREHAPVDVEIADEKVRQTYRALQSVDEYVAQIFATLESKGLLQSTIVIFSTDNGHAFGEHRWTGKNCAYEECISNPLLIRYPLIAGYHEDALVSNIDIVPTIADATDIELRNRDGDSLLPLLNNTDAPWRDTIYIRATRDPAHDNTPFDGVRSHEYKYVEYPGGECELYDLVGDPYELDNQCNNPSLAIIQAQLADQLAQFEAT